jgi:Putative auto-transporter adhesin, head GIN domain
MTYRMSTTRLRSSLLIAALGAMLAGCASDSGPARTESRAVESFHAIELRGAAEMQVEVGKGPALSITARERVLQATSTEVRDGVLVVLVRERGGWFQRGKVAKLAVQAPTLDSVQISGAGDFVLRDVAGSSLTIAVQGAGRIEANGTTGRLTARIDGAGSADLTRLVATDAQVAVNGAGRLDVNVTGALTAEVNGVGSIRYAGNPAKVVPSVHGVGSISPAGESGPAP